MSENTETVENVATKDEFDSAIHPLADLLKGVTDDANADAKKRKTLLASAKGATDEILNESDDEKIVAYRASREKIAAQIKAAQEKIAEMDAQAKAYAETLVPQADEKELEDLRQSYLAKRAKVKTVGGSVLLLLGSDEVAFKRLKDAWGIEDVISSASGKTTSGETGIVRKRLSEATVNGEPIVDNKGKTSFTLLSSKTGIDGDVIRDAMAKAAGVENVKDIPSETEVSFTVHNEDKAFEFVVTTK